MDDERRKAILLALACLAILILLIIECAIMPRMGWLWIITAALALVLLAILLAAGFILNFTVGKAVSSISGGMISPEFIISAFCLTILVVRPNIGQALVIGLISAAVIQITTTSPFVDFAAESIAAMLMAGIVNAAGKNGQVKPAIAIVATFLTTFVSGVIFMVIKMAMLGVVGELAAAMLPVVAMTAVFNAILVGALYLPIQKALKLN